MNIGIDLSSLDKSTLNQGVYTYAIGLINGFDNQKNSHKYQLYVNKNIYSHFKKKFNKKKFKIIVLKKNFIFLRKFKTLLVLFFGFLGIKIFSIHYYLTNLINCRIKKIIEKNSDIIIFLNSHENSYNLNIKSIINFHDVIHKTLPHYLKFREKIIRDVIYHNCAKSSNLIIASSKTMKKEFVDYMKIPKKKIFIINEGVNKPFYNKVSIIPKVYSRYLFYPAQFWKHKNHINLIKELNLFNQKNKDNIRLILCGKKKNYFNNIKKYLKENNLKNISILGPVSQKKLIELYHNCLAVVMPSLYESSSLVILEGLIFNKIVIASDIGPNKELSRVFKIFLFKPLKKESLSTQIKKVLSLNLKIKKKIIKYNNLHIRSYSWNNVSAKYNILINKFKKL